MWVMANMLPFSTRRELEAMRAGVKGSFGKMKEELDDHLESINANADELQSIYEYQCILEAKLDKLLERIERMEQRHTEVPELAEKEREILSVLYAADRPLTLREISQRATLSRSIVANYLGALMCRDDPPVLAQGSDPAVYGLSERFRSLQAKQNLLGLDKALKAHVTGD